MLERPSKNTNENKVNEPISESVRAYFDTISTTRQHRLAKKFIERVVEKGKLRIPLIKTEENIQQLKEFLLTQRNYRDLAVEISEELVSSGLLREPKKEEVTKEPRIYESLDNRVQLEGISQKDLDDEEQRKIESNLVFSQLKESNLINNKEALEEIYNQIENHETGSWEYYQEFVDEGIVTLLDAQGDFQSIKERKEGFNTNLNERNSTAKQIATIVERGAEFAITDLQWYGDQVTLKATSEFSDIKRGVDNLLEIKKEGGIERDFVGIATDVTFRRLEDVAFEDKFYSLLRSIKRGYKTKVKYEKDSEGQPLKEFAVPKVLLHFDYDDVKLFLNIFNDSNNLSNEDLKEKYGSHEKSRVHFMQIKDQCEILSRYAKEQRNNIFRAYDTVLNSVTELSWSDEKIKRIFDDNNENTFSKKLEELIIKFESEEKLH